MMDAHCYSEWEVIKHSIYIDVFYIDKNILMNDVVTECGVFLSIVNVVRPPVKEGYYILKYNSLSSYSG